MSKKLIYLISFVLLLGVLQAVPAVAQAAGCSLLGNDFAGRIYDVDPLTGALSAPRGPGVGSLSGISFSPLDGKLYGITASLSGTSELFTINPISGQPTKIGPTGLAQLTEGDLDFDPTTTDTLYGIYGGDIPSRKLFRLNTNTGIATIVGMLPFPPLGDPSAMAFDEGGDLYVFDNTAEVLVRVNKNTGAMLSSVPVTPALPASILAGMDFDPVTGKLYVATGSAAGGANALYTLDPNTGVITQVGPLSNANGLAGLEFVPACNIAYNPSPPDGATCVPLDVVLSWSPGCLADSHNVYFGIDPDALSLVAVKLLGQESYSPALLEDCNTYYWRIDEVCGIDECEGEVWSFTTEGCPCVDPPEGLIAWWPLDETAPSTARDIAGSHDGYHLGSPGFATGIVGGAYRFDWNNQGIVRVPNDPFVKIDEGDFTIDAWIFPETLGWWCLNFPNPDYIPCEERPIIDNRWGMAGAKGVEFFVQNATAGTTACRVLPGYLGLHMNTNYYNTQRFLSSTTPVVADEWQHVAVTVSRTGGTRVGTFYHNGVPDPVTFQPILGQLFHGVHPGWPRLDIGHGTPSSSGGCTYTNRYFSGLLDEVEIFNRALDAGEIWEIHMVCSSGKCKPSLDFGDAPEKRKWDYPTTLANNGARHIINPNVHLGDYIDAENDGQPGPGWLLALGDDIRPFGSPDDEDGVEFVTPLIPGMQQATIEVIASVAGYLDVWIDFDRSGDWNYGDEQIFVAVPLQAGLNTLVFAVPETAKSRRTCARFRFTTVAGGLPYDGLAQDGEVEDHRVIIQKGPGPSTKGSYAKWSQRPVEYDVNGLIFDGWDERSDYNRPPVPIVADDWEWKDDRPVTDFHWWGSFLGWKGAEPPPVVPKAFHIGIWTDVPYTDSNNSDTFSHPDELIWENYCENYVWNFVGFDRDPRQGEINDTCFQFNQLLSQDEWFYGEPTDANNPTIYWLSIAAIYDDVGVYRVVDDFESYDFTDNLIYETWLDGTYNGTGSWIDLGTTPDRVHGGNQSMVFIYDNNTLPYYSEGAFTPAERDWTAGGVKVLGLWFKGETYNDAEQMYVALEDTFYNVGVVKHPNPNAAQTQDWQLWCIDLTNFAAVDLNNVNKLYIGFGDRDTPVADGWGVVYFDDIRLYLYEQCLSEPNFPWGWKTRPHYYNDDAVRIATLNGGEWPPVISSVWGSGEPIEYPQGTSWDLSFEVTTNTPAYKDDPIQGDLNMDEIVNFRDLAIMADHWLEEKIWL